MEKERKVKGHVWRVFDWESSFQNSKLLF
jgi:hypothetical protein